MNYEKQVEITIILTVLVFLVFVLILILQAIYIFLRVANYTLDNISIIIGTIYQLACSIYSLYQYLAVVLRQKRVLKVRWEHIFDQELWQGMLLQKVSQIRTPGR